MRAREFTREGLRDIVNWGRNVINQSDRDAPIVMMTNPRNQGAVTNTGRGIRVQDFPLRMVPVEQLRPWEPMIKMRDLPSQRTVASLRQALQQGDKIPPLLVTPVRGGYRIIDGHHRYAALLQTGVEQAPVRVVDPRLIRYSDEVMEALKITLERYGHKRRRTNENRTATVVLDGGEQRQVRYVPGRGDWMDWIIAYYWRQNRQVQSIDGHDIDWDDDAEVVTQENTAGIDIGQEWMTDTELDQYVPDDLQQEWRELVGYDEDGNAHALWANITGDYEPDVSDPQHRAWMVKVANRWFAMKRIPNVRFFAVRDADDELEWLVQIGPQAVAESLDQPYRIKWERSMHGDYDALATLDDGTYLSIMFNKESKNNWMVEFYRNNRQEVTGEGDAQRVFATVLTAIAQFIEKKKPASLFFSAVKEDDPKGSREKLYDRLVQRYAGSLGYTVHQGRTPMGSMTYKFTRKQQGVAEGVPQPGKSSGKPISWISPERVITKYLTLNEILNSVQGIPYYNEVVKDRDAKDFSWGVTKKVLEYARELIIHPDAYKSWPPIIVVDGKLQDGAHRISTINLMQKRVQPNNPIWKNAELKVEFGKSDNVRQGVAENLADSQTILNYAKNKHHDFRMDREILDHPQWQLESMPLTSITIADYSDSDIDLDQVDRVKQDPVRSIKKSPIIIDQTGSIIDGNHRAFAARELGMRHIPAWRPVEDLDENFADGKIKGRSRPGRVKRSGASCSGSVSDLRARAQKYDGERGRMYHWCANMKSGRKKNR